MLKKIIRNYSTKSARIPPLQPIGRRWDELPNESLTAAVGGEKSVSPADARSIHAYLCTHVALR